MGATYAVGAVPSLAWLDVVKYSPRPSTADDRDDDSYRVIRASDGRPLAYIEREMWKEDEQFLARLFVRSADMLELIKELRASAKSRSNNGPILAKREWTSWFERAEDIHDDIWGLKEESEAQ